MTGARPSRGGAVGWLFAQSVAFGLWAALLGIVANAMFLEAYGAKWLPVTYIVLAVAGVVVSSLVSRAARTVDVVRIALVVLGGATVLQLAAWVIAVASGSAWVSAPLLVLFPILIHLGFVFIGGQAGRILDIAGDQGELPADHGGLPDRGDRRRAARGTTRRTARADGAPAAAHGARGGGVRDAGVGDGPALPGPVRGRRDVAAHRAGGTRRPRRRPGDRSDASSATRSSP